MGRRGASSSALEAGSCSGDLKCLFCGQSLVGLPNRDHENINKLKRIGSSRKRKNQEETIPPSTETLFGGMEVMRKALQVESAFPGEDVRNSVSVEEICCNKCFATLGNLVKIQEQIDTLEASKFELVQLLHTLIANSGPWRKSEFLTHAESWSLLSQFRKQVSKNLPKLRTPSLKIENETGPTSAEVSTVKVDMQPVVQLERADFTLSWTGDTSLNNTLGDGEDEFYPPDSPEINWDEDDVPESDESYQPEETRKKKKYEDIWVYLKRIKSCESYNLNKIGKKTENEFNKLAVLHITIYRNTIIRGRLTAVGYEVKRKRGRRKQAQPSIAENATPDPPAKRGRRRPLNKKETKAHDSCQDAAEKRKGGSPSKTSLVTPDINETNAATEDPYQSVSDGEDLEVQPMDTSTNDSKKSQKKAKNRKTHTDSHPQQHSSENKIIDDSSKRWKEDASAFYPVYALNQVEGEYMFLFVKFKITPTSFLCQHPNCSEEVRYVGHFTEQTAFLMQRLHIRKEHRVGFRNRYKYKSDADASKHYYCCCHCELQLESMSELTEHCEEHHDETASPLAVCEVCGYTTAEEDLLEHILTHKSAGEKEAVKELPSRKLKQASRTVLFPCDECDKIFRNTTELRTHRVKHVPAEQRRQHICDLCGELYMSASMLKNHISSVHFKHELDRPFECPYCEKTFLKIYRGNYEEHVRTHLTEKPFQCDQCGKGFGSQRKYKTHVETHVYEPIPCQFCGKMYKTKNSMRVHHKKHHPELRDRSKAKPAKSERIECYGPALMHPCEPCGHCYRYKSTLVAHMKNKHKMQLERNEDYPTMWTWEDDIESRWRR